MAELGRRTNMIWFFVGLIIGLLAGLFYMAYKTGEYIKKYNESNVQLRGIKMCLESIERYAIKIENGWANYSIRKPNGQFGTMRLPNTKW